MPRVEQLTQLPFPMASVFRVLTQPSNWPLLVPADMALRIIKAPTQVETDSVVEIEGKYWGFKRKLKISIQRCDRPRSFVQIHLDGPFQRWEHGHLFEEVANQETCLTEVLEFEGPGGMLGMILTPARVEREFRRMAEARAVGISHLLGK